MIAQIPDDRVSGCTGGKNSRSQSIYLFLFIDLSIIYPWNDVCVKFYEGFQSMGTPPALHFCEGLSLQYIHHHFSGISQKGTPHRLLLQAPVSNANLGGDDPQTRANNVGLASGCWT